MRGNGRLDLYVGTVACAGVNLLSLVRISR